MKGSKTNSRVGRQYPKGTYQLPFIHTDMIKVISNLKRRDHHVILDFNQKPKFTKFEQN